ncbi:aspartyl protease family protein [Lutibacter sp. A80]|uniref:aspartyl protease family protein n=1 Tax=Lutibacter sp. A80 TaxID=2918453 RepID=UPI001F0602C0|nr:aspartyl protease family protein [Lutibacter sp. A80]UMB61176.1 aspartyl protease family protein [Lutibacter sp. A80]
MKLTKLLCSLIIITLLSSCASSKINKTLKQGNIVQEDFKTTIPFEYRKGLIILKVTIENETYDFILDTGASNALSKELAEKLNVTSLGSENITDVHKTSQLLNYTKIDDIEIGGIHFQNTIAAISDFNSGELACLNVDGFIGSNLMRFAIWDFDFKNQIITITDNEQQLNIPADAIESKMFIGTAASQPSIISYINGEKALNNMIDLGNNSTPHLSYLDFVKQKESNKISKYILGSGYTTIGMYGKGEKRDEISAKVDEIKIGNHIIKNKVMKVKDGKTNLGISFFKNYRLILNWEARKVTMIQEGVSNNTALNHFGFIPSFNGNKVFVDFIYNDTAASKVLQFGDEVLQINSIDFTNITDNNKCAFFDKGIMPKGTDEITIKVLRNGETLEFQLKKTLLL